MQVTFTMRWHRLSVDAICNPERKENASVTAVSFHEADEREGGRERDLHFWEIHKLGPYLVVQSQYVLVNKRALQVEQSEKHKEGTLNYCCAMKNLYPPKQLRQKKIQKPTKKTTTAAISFLHSLK